MPVMLQVVHRTGKSLRTGFEQIRRPLRLSSSSIATGTSCAASIHMRCTLHPRPSYISGVHQTSDIRHVRMQQPQAQAHRALGAQTGNSQKAPYAAGSGSSGAGGGRRVPAAAVSGMDRRHR